MMKQAKNRRAPLFSFPGMQSAISPRMDRVTTNPPLESRPRIAGSQSGLLEGICNLILVFTLACTSLALTASLARGVFDEMARYRSIDLVRGIGGL